MKRLLIYVCIMAHMLFNVELNAQCNNPLNGPFPIPEYETYSCAANNCDQPQLISASWQPGDGWILQVPNLNPFFDYYVDFGNDPAVLPFSPLLEITLYDIGTGDILFSQVGLELFFQLPGPGDYGMTITEIGGCGVLSLLGPFSGFSIDAPCPMFCPWDRQEALGFLLTDPDLVFDSTQGLIMSPFDDFGFGDGFEGLMPGGTQFGSALDFIVETPPTPKFLDEPSYLFFLDPFPGLMFQHDVQYFTVNALHPTPTLAGGGITLCPSDWWPYVLLPGFTGPLELFGSSDDYYSDDPVGPFNSDGLSGGSASATPFNKLYTDCPVPVSKANNKRALVFSGFDENRAKNSVKKAKERLNMRDCYDKDNITTIDNATQQQMCDSLDAILAKTPVTEELCIYIIAHGIERADGTTVGGFGVNGGMITPNEWKAKMDSIAKKGIVTHITFETCRATAIGNPFTWNLPEGSSVTFASSATESAWAFTYKTPSCDTINEGIFSHAIEECRNDMDADQDEDGSVSHKEGVNWVLKSKPCYSTLGGNSKGRYPAGPPTDSVGANPDPSLVCIGEHASSISRRYKMPATFDADKVCIKVSGDRRNGTGLVYTSSGDVFVPHTLTKTYDAASNTTEICFTNPTKFTRCVKYWFHYYDNTGMRMQVVSAVASTNPPFNGSNSRNAMASDADLPTTDVQTALSLDGSELVVTILNRGISTGGIGENATLDVGYRISNDSIPYAELNDGHPSYTSLSLVSVASGVALDTNDVFQFALDLPQEILPGQYLFVETTHTWAVNANETKSIDQFSAVGTVICLPNIVYSAGDIIPKLSNAEDFINFDGANLFQDTSAFNAGMEINLLPNTEIPMGKDIIFYILGCDPN